MILLMLFAVLVRAPIAARSTVWLRADVDNYREFAENLLAHGTYGPRPDEPSAYRPPLYPLLLVPAVRDRADDFTSLVVLHVVLGLAAVWLTAPRRRAVGAGPGAVRRRGAGRVRSDLAQAIDRRHDRDFGHGDGRACACGADAGCTAAESHSGTRRGRSAGIVGFVPAGPFWFLPSLRYPPSYGYCRAQRTAFASPRSSPWPWP